MPTKAELIDRIKRDLARKDRDTLTITVLRDAVIAAGVVDRDALVAAVVAEDNARTGTVLNDMVSAHLEDLADTEATAMLADDTLSLAELDRWLD